MRFFGVLVYRLAFTCGRVWEYSLVTCHELDLGVPFCNLWHTEQIIIISLIRFAIPLYAGLR
jgi:hypothetical protein